mmetsp:Transcript_15653/g.25602  ORF Transcript_15653/g.25602 Transcript_15653/m.25602 type:complete len:597 (-) Transcript_15653:1569-3359(-)
MGNSDSKAELRGYFEGVVDGECDLNSADFVNVFWDVCGHGVFDVVQPSDVERLLLCPDRLKLLLLRGVEELEKKGSRGMNVVCLFTRMFPFLLGQDLGMFWDSDCIGDRLIRCVGEYLFLPGVTIDVFEWRDDDTDGEDNVNRDLVWGDEVGFRVARRRVLRLLLVLQSEVLFGGPSCCEPSDNVWVGRSVLFGRCVLPHSRELFLSLLNQVCCFDGVGWGVPYMSAVGRGDAGVALVDTSLQVLLALLQANSGDNLFRRYVSEFEDYGLVYNGIVGLLNNIPDAENTYLPGSKTRLESNEEVLVLLWNFLYLNVDFLHYVVCDADVSRILEPICFFLWNGRKQASQVGCVHICVFLLLLLSADRNFGVGLNKVYRNTLRLESAPVMSNVNYGDLLIIVLHKVIVDGNTASLHHCFLTILANNSPYIKTVSRIASIKLLSLFGHFSKRRFLASEASRQNVMFLLDIFNNVIQYQYQGNPYLIYAICVEEQKFRALHNTQVGEEPRLPCATVIRLLDVLMPKISEIENVNEDKILNLVQNCTLVGLLPIPHSIFVRRYEPNSSATVWFTTYLWGVIFLRNQGLWDGGAIKLFVINLK